MARYGKVSNVRFDKVKLLLLLLLLYKGLQAEFS